MKRLVFSFVNVLVLGVLFVSLSYAWFTDSVESPNNRVQIGNLRLSIVSDVSLTPTGGLYNLSGTSAMQDLRESAVPVFDFGGRVEPGQALTRFIRVRNIGVIMLDYELTFHVKEAYLAPFVLFDIVAMDVTTGQPVGDVTTINGTELNLIPTLINGTGLMNEEYTLYRITIRMSETLGNEFNFDSPTAQAFDFDVIALAWQSNFPQSRP